VPSLRGGRAVEQWLGLSTAPGASIRFVRIDRQNDGTYAVAWFERLDEGSADNCDVYEFSPVDPDTPYGDVSTFASAEAALVCACEHHGAVPGRWLNAGMVQDEYRDAKCGID
jgi:hypothetical protein